MLRDGSDAARLEAHCLDAGERPLGLRDESLSLLNRVKREPYSDLGRCLRIARVVRQLWLSKRATNIALSWGRALETETARRLHLPFSSRSMVIPSLALRLSALLK